MPTATDILTRSFQRAGIYSPEENIVAADMQTGFQCLNEMIDSWSVDRLFLYQLVSQTLQSTAGKAQYTVGPGGDFAGTRITQINDVTYTGAPIDYPVTEISVDDYSLITYKAATGIPDWFCYEASSPLGVMSLYPVPNTGGTLTITSAQQLSQFAALNTNVIFPPGYLAAVRLSLSEILRGEFDLQDSATLSRSAAVARQRIRRMNVRVPTLQVDIVSNAGSRNILNGFRP